MPSRRLGSVLLALAFLAVAAAPARAYRLNPIVPQPELRYFVALDDWKAPMGRAIRALNRAHVGVKLVKAQIPEQATIQVGRLEKRCGLPGVDGTTTTLQGGYAVIYLPRRCRATQGTIIAAHELGHALGLAHESRRCALMNASGTGPNSIPTLCLGKRFNWRRKPFRKDDLRGLKAAFHNTPPKVSLDLKSPTTVTAGTPVEFAIKSRDAEGNLSELRMDYGDGEKETFDPSQPPIAHSYLEPGTYTLSATAVDFYLKKDTATATITVTPEARAARTATRTVTYGHGAVADGSQPLLLDLYRPAGAAQRPRPVVVLIHGGGFVAQSRSDAGVVRVARGLAAEGIVVASIDYRLAGSDPQPSARVAPLVAAFGGGQTPNQRAVVAAVDDTLTAVRYLRRHRQDLGIDMGRLGLVGSSAGAITANHVAYVLDDHDVAGPRVRFVGDLWGGVIIGAATQLEAGEAPLFAVHGDADPILPVTLDDTLVARAREEGVRTEYHRIPGGGHGFDGSGFFEDPAYPRLLRFARRALGR